MILYIYVVILILLSAIFTSLEIAFFSLDEIEFMTIVHSKHKHADKLIKLKKEKDNLLLSILICNNGINISASALNTYLAYNLAITYEKDPNFYVTAATIALTIAIIIFCEAIPKIIGIRLKQNICTTFAPLLIFINNVAKPITGFLLLIFLSFSKIKYTFKKAKPEFYQKAFVGLTEKSMKEGLIGQNEGELIRNVMALNRHVLTIMRPRNQVFALKSDLKVQEVFKEIAMQKYSRFPVFIDNLDNINGVVHIHNLFERYIKEELNKSLLEIASPPIFIRDTWTIWHVLNILQKENGHLAIVIDEFGGMSGIITMEDILEELVGEIRDEKDKLDEQIIEYQTENHWITQGSVEIRALNKILSMNLPLDEEYETLQGFIMHRLKKIPAIHDQVLFDNQWLFVISTMQKNEVKIVDIFKQVRVTED